MKKYPKNILILRLSSIGDIVLTSPLIRTLRKCFPKSDIDFVVKKEYADLVKYNPNLNFIYELDTTKGFKGLRGLKKEIRKKSYGLILDIHKNFRTTYLRLFSNAKIKKLYRKRRFIRTLLVLCKINKYKQIIPIHELYFKALKDFTIEIDSTKPEFYIPDEIQTKVNKLLLEKDYTERDYIITFCIGAGFFTKRWPEEYFAKLIDMINENNMGKIIVLGGTVDIERGNNIEKTSKLDILNLCGKLRIIESAAVIKCSSVIISNDSGLMHIAQAFNKNLVAIFGSTTKELGYFPVSENSTVLEKDLKCRPCSHNGKNKCPEKHFRCMREIEPEEVLNTIQNFKKVEEK